MVGPRPLVVQGVGEDFGEVAHGSGLYDVVKGKVWRNSCNGMGVSAIRADTVIMGITTTSV